MAAAVDELHVVPPSDLDTDDDDVAELAELFGEEVGETPPPSPPPSESQEKAPARPGILERLLAKDGAQLSNGVVGIVRDARAAIDANVTSQNETPATTQASASEAQAQADSAGSRVGVSLVEVARKRRRRQDVGIESDGAARKKARNAFAVLGRAPSVAATKHSFDDTEWTGMRLQDCPHTAAQFGALFEAFTVINIAELADKAVEIRSKAIRDPLVFGALVKKAGKRTAKDGGRYAVWVMANMPLQARCARGKPPPPLTTIHCLLFGDAFERHHTAPEGTVFALRAPTLLPPRDGGGGRAKHAKSTYAQAGWCMTVRTADQVVALAHAADYGLCAAEKPGGAACGEWFHRGYSSRCHYHTRALLKRHTSTARMVINNAVRPGAATRAVFRPATAPVNVSEQCANAGLIDRYASTERRLDDVQLARARRDDAKTRRILADRDKRKISDIRTRVRGNERSTLSRLRTNTRPKMPQDRMLAAMRTLVAMGFQLAADGTLTPPTPNKSNLVGIDVAACVAALSSRTRPTSKVSATATATTAKASGAPQSKTSDEKSVEKDALDDTGDKRASNGEIDAAACYNKVGSKASRTRVNDKDTANDTIDGKVSLNETNTVVTSNETNDDRAASRAAGDKVEAKDTYEDKDTFKARASSAYAKLSAMMAAKKENDAAAPPQQNAPPPTEEQVKHSAPVPSEEQGDIELSDSSDDE